MSENPQAAKSISFDRAAGFYDRTRGHDPAVSRQIADTFQSLVPPASRLLEIGIGTGRIAIPLMQRGYAVFGIDLSRRMMERLSLNLPANLNPPGLAEANAGFLPFASASFDAVVTVHVFHLIAEWRQTLAEIRRILRPGGSLIHGLDWRPEDAPSGKIRDRWLAILQAHGRSSQQPGIHYDQLDEYLRAAGATLEEYIAAEWESPFSVNEYIQEMADGVYSISWQAPLDQRPGYVEELHNWALTTFPHPDETIYIPRRFIWQRYSWQ